MFWKREGAEKGTLRKRLQEDEEAEIGLTRAHVCGLLEWKIEREGKHSVFMCSEAHLILSETWDRS